MIDPVFGQLARMILASMYKKSGEDGLRTQFLFGRPGTPLHEHRLGTEVYFRQSELIQAALHSRKNGPTYLKFVAVETICEMLKTFTTENFWLLGDEIYFKQFSCSFDEMVRDLAKQQFATALRSSPLFDPPKGTTLFPLVSLRTTADIRLNVFGIVEASRLHSILPEGSSRLVGQPTQFPPVDRWSGRRETASSWLAITSPNVHSSLKLRSIILGSMALTPTSRVRYTFSGRKNWGGCCHIEGGIGLGFIDALMPPIMSDIVLSDSDTPWLSILDVKLSSNDGKVRKQLHALEYYYRAWFLTPSERYPILCMALDSIFGSTDQATESVIDGVMNTLESITDRNRLKLLLKLRNSVVHGGAPDVYESSKYERYYREYRHDPIYDLELVVTRCLQRIIFGSSFREQPDPYAKAIEARGQLKHNLDARNIFNGL